MDQRKSPTLFAFVVGSWFAVVLAAAVAFFTDPGVISAPPLIILTLLLNSCCFAFFWLVGLKDLSFVAAYYLRGGRPAARIPANGLTPSARVVLLYCTADDFDEYSLAVSMNQDVDGCATVILDDSRRLDVKARVDAFAKAHELRVVRRDNRNGFKAGNLNHYLVGLNDYDYFVLLDSDEIIPPNFVSMALGYFAHYPAAGIIQGNHSATRGRNRFMTLLGKGVQPQVQTFQTVKQRHGFPHLMGHGAMVSRECFEASGGFPEQVMEDLAFSVEARLRGFETIFAHDIQCEEEYPVDYRAFKKRHAKWTEGTIEFIRLYSWRILRSKMAWFEKVDIFLTVYPLPLAALLAFILVVTNLVVLPIAGYLPGYPLWLAIPSLIFMLAPLANDIVHQLTGPARRDLIPYLAHSFLLYSSTFYLTLAMSVRAAFGGRARFVVTPKDGTRSSILSAVRDNVWELFFGLTLVVVAVSTLHTALPVLMIIVPCYLTVYLSLLANKDVVSRAASAQTR